MKQLNAACIAGGVEVIAQCIGPQTAGFLSAASMTKGISSAMSAVCSHVSAYQNGLNKVTIIVRLFGV